MQRAVLLPLLVLLLPISSAADPITIQQGSIVVRRIADLFAASIQMNLRGTGGVVIHEFGANDAQWGTNCRPCEPGRVFDFGGFGVEDAGGAVRFGNQSFPISFSGNTATVVTTAFAILPSPKATATFSVPFEMHGSVNLVIDDQPFQQFDFAGRGTATIRLVADSPNPLWNWAGSRFDFGAPTPEPATLLLLASGLAGTMWTRRRSRTRNATH
jgi:PEP-CTERM motif-containing protein